MAMMLDHDSLEEVISLMITGEPGNQLCHSGDPTVDACCWSVLISVDVLVLMILRPGARSCLAEDAFRLVGQLLDVLAGLLGEKSPYPRRDRVQDGGHPL